LESKRNELERGGSKAVKWLMQNKAAKKKLRVRDYFIIIPAALLLSAATMAIGALLITVPLQLLHKLTQKAR
jgi:hypothetical protein